MHHWQRPLIVSTSVFLALVAAFVLLGCAKPPTLTLTATAPAPGAPSPAVAAPWTPPAPPAEPPAEPPAPAPAPVAVETPPPPATPPAAAEFTATDALTDIHFDFDKYDLGPGSALILDSNVEWLKGNPTTLVLLEGHADERGTDGYNLALGERRAKSALDYLLAQGIPAARLTAVSYGRERPLCTEHHEACWVENRRVHFVVKPAE